MKVIQNDETVSRVQPFLLVGDGDYPPNPNPRQDIGAYITAPANMTLPSTTAWAGVTWRIANYNLSTNNITVTLAGGDSYLFGGNVLVVRPGEMYALTAIVSNDQNVKIVAPVGWFGAQALSAPRCKLSRTAAQTLTNAAYTKIIFDTGNATEDFDTAALHDPTTNPTRITIGETGVYLIGGRVSFASDADGNRILDILRNNTTTLGDMRLAPSAATATNLMICSVAALSASDYIELRAYHNAGADIATTDTSLFWCVRIA